MSDVRTLEEQFGGWWCGVRFGEGGSARRVPETPPLRFCEAVAASRTAPITLTPERLNCPGASRCLGWSQAEDAVAQGLADQAGLSIEVAREVLRNTPHLDPGIEEVTFGTYEAPDVVIAFTQPELAMRLLRVWQGPRGFPLHVQASSFMSVCGAVAVRAYLSGQVCMSFGCPEARRCGSIGRDRLVVGLPLGQAHELGRAVDAIGVAATAGVA